MQPFTSKFLGIVVLLAVLLLVSGCNTAQQPTPTAPPTAESTAAAPSITHEPFEIERSAEVPPLPFPDNPDPSQCGIPRQWSSSEPAYLSGLYEGELIQPDVYLYDSHLRRDVVGQAPHGAEVEILLSQSNPELDYFMVKVANSPEPVEGWVPAPFVTFEPPATVESP